MVPIEVTDRPERPFSAIMIDGFKAPELLEPLEKDRMQWGAALEASLIAGVVLLLVPRGSPWSSFTFFAPTVFGRSVAPLGWMLGATALIHMAVSLVYGLLIARVVAGLRRRRAIVSGALMGLVLYVINFGLVSTFWPELRGSEVSVVFTHVVFGLIAAGAYRGLLKRRAVTASLI